MSFPSDSGSRLCLRREAAQPEGRQSGGEAASPNLLSDIGFTAFIFLFCIALPALFGGS